MAEFAGLGPMLTALAVTRAGGSRDEVRVEKGGREGGDSEIESSRSASTKAEMICAWP